MAYGSSKDVDVYLDSHGGVLTDITAYVTSCEPTVGGNLLDVATYGDAWEEVIRGRANAGFTVEGIYDPYMGTFLPPLATATSSSSFEIYPQGSASGKPKLSGECFMESSSVPSSGDEAVTWAASFKVTGALTSGTI